MKYMLADNIRNFNEINKFSLRESAAALKVNHVIIADFVNDRRNSARLGSVMKIASGMNVSIDDLLFSNIFKGKKI